MPALTFLVRLLFWFVIPATLIASVILRYNLLSLIYLLFLLALPYLPQQSPVHIATWDNFTLTLTLTSGFFILGHIVFQIALLASSPYGSLLGDNCSTAESIARYIGFHRFTHVDGGNVIRQLLPDVVIFVIALLTYVLIKRIRSFFAGQTYHRTMARRRPVKPSRLKLKHESILYLTMVFLPMAGIAAPNVISSLYILAFFGFATAWAFLITLIDGSTVFVRIILSIVTISNLIILYIYQFQFMQEYIPPSNIYSRLFGLSPIIVTDCNATAQLLFNPAVPWPQYVSPFCILLLHWVLAIGIQMFFRDRKDLKHLALQATVFPESIFSKRRKPGEKSPLVEAEDLQQGYDAVEAAKVVTDGQSAEEQDVPSTSNVAPMPSGDGVSCTSRGHRTSYDKEYILFQLSTWFNTMTMYSLYVIALIVMMVWSVTYHSWLTFVLLLGSCILWMLKDRAHYTLLLSPFLVFYGILLVLLQYIYSLNLTESELPTVINKTDHQLVLSDYGIYRFEYSCLHLGAQILFVCGFWLVLHQHNLRRKNTSQTTVNEVSNRPRSKKTETDKVVDFIFEQFCKYWIFAVVGCHLAVSTEGSPTGIKIVFMLFFLLNMVTYTASWTLWKRLLTLYWTVLVVYIMIVLVIIYTYQFQDFPYYWKSLTNFTDDQLHDLGLQQASSSGNLLVMILVPAIFLLLVILQLQYFNKRFLELTKPVATHSALPGAAPAIRIESDDIEMNDLSGMSFMRKDEKQRSWFLRTFVKWKPTLLKAWDEFMSFIMLVFEYHLWKLVFVTVFVAAVYQVSALYAVFVIAWVLLLPFRRTHVVLFAVTSLFASIIIIGIMFYQLQFMTPDLSLTYVCTWSFYGDFVNKTYHLTDWLGVAKMPADGAFFYHVEGLIAIVIMIAFERTVVRRQKWRHSYRNETPCKVTAVFPNITHREADNNLSDCVKYMINYFFYKFGAEICFVMTVIVIWVRTDVFAVAYCLLLIIALCLKSRVGLYRYWRFYLVCLMVLVIWQYLASLGMPSIWCQYHHYPWLIIGDNATIRNRLVTWLHLPDYIAPSEVFPSIADFFLLLFVVCQLGVFQKSTVISEFAGNIKYLSGRELDGVIPGTNMKKNFTRKKYSSMLDQAKLFVFMHFIWITMAIIFFAGTSRISVFTLGYLIIFFYMVGKQQTLIRGRPSRLLNIFSALIGYTIAVITMKACLQLASCVYTEVLHSRACVFVQLMSLSCALPHLYDISNESEDDCVLLYTTAGFSWDFVCFLFLLIQRRIFASYYFLHVADDMRVALSLAARGAELFHERLVESVNMRKLIEDETINKIRTSMMSIRKSHIRKALGSTKYHLDAIRAGDYYMFQDDSYFPKLSKFELRSSEDEIMGPVSMIHRAETSGISNALKEREKDKRKITVTVTSPRLSPDHQAEQDSITRLSHDKLRRSKVGELSRADYSKSSLGFEPDHGGVSRVTFRQTARRRFPSRFDEDAIYERDSDESFVSKYSSDEEEVEDKEKKTFWEKIVQGMKFLWELFLSGIDYLTVVLNKYNKDYRNIVLQLAWEKDALSEQQHYRMYKSSVVVPPRLSKMKQKARASSTVSKIPEIQIEEEVASTSRATLSSESKKQAADPKDRTVDPRDQSSNLSFITEDQATDPKDLTAIPKDLSATDPKDQTAIPKDLSATDPKDQTAIPKDLSATAMKEFTSPETSPVISKAASVEPIIDVYKDPGFDAIKASELDEDSVKNAYKDLSPMEFDKEQPRAIRLFYAIWYVIISGTDLVCYFLIILNLMLNPSIVSLVLPLAIFLVATLIIPRPAKRFWKFAIAYLEVLIVIKFLFQFEFWPWNAATEVNMNKNNPFWWPRLLGIEQSSSWSIMDLLQLLSIFFHASIMQVHGLWDHIQQEKESDTEIYYSSTGENTDEMQESAHSSIDDGNRSSSKVQLVTARRRKYKQGWSRIVKKPFKLYSTLFSQRIHSVTDVYLYMFLCDVINFIIIIFGYDAFGQYSTTSIVSNIQSNNVPTAFLVMLLIQFIIMIIDRAIYLMKSLKAKFIFQVVLVIGIHVWMFFILPSLNQRPFYQNHIAQTYYFFKAVYFLLASYQIRAGYPKRVSGNFLTKSYGTVNLFLFKGYRVIPFLAEITALMDWMYTGTSMGISEWMKLWAIHAEVFEIKCWRVFEATYPTPRGIAKQKWIKYLAGGFLLCFLLSIVWFPLLLMNIAQTIGGIVNNPIQVDVKITLGSFEPVFQVAADLGDIRIWTKDEFRDFSLERSGDEDAASFLQAFSGEQVVSVSIDGESKTVWIISPPQKALLTQRLSPNDTRPVKLLYEWTITNDPAKTSVVTSSGSNEMLLYSNSTARKRLYDLLRGHSNDTNVTIDHLFPPYIHSRGSSSLAGPAIGLYSNGTDGYSDVEMTLNQTLPTSPWWRIQVSQNGTKFPQIEMIVFSDKVSPSSLNFLVNYGIIGLYVSVVLVVGRLIRTIIIGTTSTIMFTELPYVDRILNLCNDIFLVREEAEYKLEEDLFAKLIFLYRSPKTLIQWTRARKNN